MTPSPYLQLLPTIASDLDVAGGPAAAFVLDAAADGIARWQAQANTAGLALIVPEARGTQQSDGIWTQDLTAVKTLRSRLPEAQIAVLVQEIHEAMSAAEAGADLILFGGFEPVFIMGDYEKAMDWALISEIPCGCIVARPPTSDREFGREGTPEFFLSASI